MSSWQAYIIPGTSAHAERIFPLQREWLSRHGITDIIRGGNPVDGHANGYIVLRDDVFFDIDLSWLMMFASDRGSICAALRFHAAPGSGTRVAIDADYHITPQTDGAEGYSFAGVYAGTQSALTLIDASFEDSIAVRALSGTVTGIPFGGNYHDGSSPLHAPVTRSSALFLDRDGILIDDPGYLSSVADVRIIEHAVTLIRTANARGRKVIVLTNQAGVAKGKFTERDVHTVNDHISREFASRGAHIDGWYYCPTHPKATVDAYRRESIMRKPNPGMLLMACEEHGIDPVNAVMVGDKDSDALRLPYLRNRIIPGKYPITRTELIASWESIASEL